MVAHSTGDGRRGWTGVARFRSVPANLRSARPRQDEDTEYAPKRHDPGWPGFPQSMARHSLRASAVRRLVARSSALDKRAPLGGMNHRRTFFIAADRRGHVHSPEAPAPRGTGDDQPMGKGLRRAGRHHQRATKATDHRYACPSDRQPPEHRPLLSRDRRPSCPGPATDGWPLDWRHRRRHP